MKKKLNEVKRLQRIAGLIKEDYSEGYVEETEANPQGTPIKVVADEDGNMDWQAPGAGYVLIRRIVGRGAQAAYYPEVTDKNVLKSKFIKLTSTSIDDLIVVLHDAQGSFSSRDPEESYLYYDGTQEPAEIGGIWYSGSPEELSTPPNYGM